jgi:hypothetical protein
MSFITYYIPKKSLHDHARLWWEGPAGEGGTKAQVINVHWVDKW